MNHRALALAALALAAVGCNKGSSGPAFRFAEPSSVAVFRGYASQHGSLHPYVAVANSGQDELVLFDPVDDKVVAAPILIRPVSIPLPHPRPALVASAQFQRPVAAGATTPDPSFPDPPDLLVAVSSGSTELQLIRTWKRDTAPDPGLEDVTVDLGGEIQALIATPSVDASGAVVPDRVRVIASIAGGTLAVVEFQWTPASDYNNFSGKGTVEPVGTVTTQRLGFEALSLAVDASIESTPWYPPLTNAAPYCRPKNPAFLYVATSDPIPPSNVQGVAELDMRGTPGAWTVRALDAHAPTRLVAAFTLAERVITAAGAYDVVHEPSKKTDTAPEVGYYNAFRQNADGKLAYVPRVYAYRDPAWCGVDTDVQCGIAVIDPVAGDVLEDPWHTGQDPKQYLPPIPVPSNPVALVPIPPPVHPPTDSGIPEDGELMQLTVSGYRRLTTGALVVPSDDGRSYVADLARWEIPSNSYELNTLGTPTSITGWRQGATDLPQIGFFEPPSIRQADVTNGSSARNPWIPDAGATEYFELTPGFTPTDYWSVTYQGYLPQFHGSRTADVEDAVPASPGGGLLRVAFQAHAGAGLTQVVNVFDPALGVRVGDVVEIHTGPQETGCPDTTTTDPATSDYNPPVEGKIVEVAKPDAAHPGGSLVIQKGDCVPVTSGSTTECDAEKHGPWTTMDGCWPAAGWTGGAAPPIIGSRQVRIRASGGAAPDTTDVESTAYSFVVVGAATGYAGRATSIVTEPADAAARDALWAPGTDQTFRFSSDDEALACPLIPYPLSWDRVPDCDAACRLQCERAAVARRARRTHLPSVFCSPSSEPTAKNYCETHFPKFAIQPAGSTAEPVGTFGGEPPSGPALRFALRVHKASATAIEKRLVRDTQVGFQSRSGLTPVSRYGGGGNGGPATGPGGGAWFDRSGSFDWGERAGRARVFVPHVGNLVLDVSPSRNNSDTKVLR